MSVDVPGAPPIMFDLGTGARYFGAQVPRDRPFDGVCLLSHLHWDHIQGLPFFQPLLEAGSRLVVHAPVQDDDLSVADIVDGMLCPPLFPVGLDAFPGTIDFVTHGDDSFEIGPVTVMTRLIPHLGTTLGYRLTYRDRAVAYLSDHQQPGVDVYDATQSAKDLCRGADILIHDAQYTRDEFAGKPNWGHCTIDYAMWLGQECDVDTLVLYHHDPTHDDAMLDRVVDDASGRLEGIRLIAAREGLTLRVGS